MLKQFITSKQDRSGLQSPAGEAVAVGHGMYKRLSASGELCGPHSWARPYQMCRVHPCELVTPYQPQCRSVFDPLGSSSL